MQAALDSQLLTPTLHVEVALLEQAQDLRDEVRIDVLRLQSREWLLMVDAAL